MKQIKNNIFAVAGGVLMLAAVAVSCKKKDAEVTPSTPAPTISTATPASVHTGDTILVTGTGFTATGTTAKIGALAQSVLFVDATHIKVIVASSTTTGALVITNAGGPSTSTTITVTAAPGSDDVAASNLLAHWTFDVNSTEAISGVSALTGGAYNVGTVSYASAGVIGNCATFTNGALVYPSINKLNLDTALQSYTVSMWVKLDTAGAGSHWKSLFQLNANAYTDLFGIVGIQALNQRSADTLALQITQTQIDGTGVHTGGFGCGGCFSSTSLTNPIIYKPSASNGWTLLTTTYNGNGNNQKLKVYANGVIVDSLTLSTVTKPETFRIRAGGGPGGASGETIPTSWADFVTIGTFNWKEFSVFSNSNGYNSYSATAASRSGYMSNGITGKIDDIRVYNTYLSAAEVANLYAYGVLGK